MAFETSSPSQIAMKVPASHPTHLVRLQEMQEAIASVEAGGDGTTPVVQEAPRDGKPYVRKDGTWTEQVDTDTVFPEAPTDGKQYARQDGGWSEVVAIPVEGGDSGIEEAPEDGKPYVRKDGSWVEQTDTDTVFPEASTDGNYYVRGNGEWSELRAAILALPAYTGFADWTS